MTRQNDGDWVEPIGAAHGTRRGGLADARGLLTVGSGVAGRDGAQGLPDCLLEGGPAGFDLDIVDRLERASKVCLQATAELERVIGIAKGICAAVASPQQAVHPRLVVAVIEEVDRLRRTDDEQFANGRRHPQKV